VVAVAVLLFMTFKRHNRENLYVNRVVLTEEDDEEVEETEEAVETAETEETVKTAETEETVKTAETEE